MKLIILEKKLLAYISCEPNEQDAIRCRKDALLVVSDDFEHLGFFVCTISAPLNRVWTFFPYLRFESVFCAKIYKRISRKANEERGAVLNYFKMHGISRRKINNNFLPVYELNPGRVLGCKGDYWTVLVPSIIMKEFIAWISNAIDVMLNFSSEKFEERGRTWRVGGFDELGNWFPMWAMMKSEEARKYIRKIYGDCKYPTDRLKEDIFWLIEMLDDIARAFALDGPDKFLYFNSPRQTSVLLPYFDDSYDVRLPLKLLLKRVNYVNDFNIPHFYKSIKYGVTDETIGAWDQLNHLIECNYMCRRELQDSKGVFEKYLLRMDEVYRGSLVFNVL